MVKDHSDSKRGTRCSHIGYSFWLTARVLLYASSHISFHAFTFFWHPIADLLSCWGVVKHSFIHSSHIQDNTYHSLCYTSCGALAGTRNSCSERGNSFQLAARIIYIHHPKDRIVHTLTLVSPAVEHWLEQEIDQWIMRNHNPEMTTLNETFLTCTN